MRRGREERGKRAGKEERVKGPKKGKTSTRFSGSLCFLKRVPVSRVGGHTRARSWVDHYHRNIHEPHGVDDR